MSETGFVPTMGALHAGHAALISAARKRSEKVIVSVFVNPLQFNDPEDLRKYPRTPERDEEIALAAGASEVWFPKYEEIYPAEPELIQSGPVGELFEGASRPGHFTGMLTVVKRLFDLVKPDFAIFGEKDFQQLFLIKQMVKNLNLPIDIVAAPIVRDTDGLALSSRNVRLSAKGRKSALIISKALQDGEMNRDKIIKILESEKNFTLDYAEIIDSDNFAIANSETQNKRAIIAGWVEGVRLIDNG